MPAANLCDASSTTSDSWLNPARDARIVVAGDTPLNANLLTRRVEFAPSRR